MEKNKKLIRIHEYEYANDFRRLVEYAAEKYGESTAYIIKNRDSKLKETTYRNISFREHRDDINALAAYFISKGFGNDPIAIVGKNSYQWATSYFACLTAGIITVPLDKALPEGELSSSIMRSYAKTLVYDPDLQETVNAIQSDIGEDVRLISMSEFEDILSDGRAILQNVNQDKLFSKIDPDRLAVILFTSGTTSASKAVMLSQSNILQNAYDAVTTEDILHGDVNMAFLPYHHTFGATGQVVMLYAGVTTAFCDGLKYIQKNLVEYKVSVFVCVPLLIEAIYKKILAGVKKQKAEKKLAFGIMLTKTLSLAKIDLRRKVFKDIVDQLGGSLRFIISGASALDPNVIKGLEYFGISVIQGYGLTETAPILSAENMKNRRTGSVGKAMPQVDLKLVDVNSEGIGQITAKGPNVMLGYFENQEATDEVIKDGWFYTGDLGYIDKDGYIFIKGRAKNVIVLKNGKNVYPEEIETLITKLPFVEEVFVFGQEKSETDLVVTAKIVYKPDYLEEHLGVKTHDEIKEVIKNEIDKINETMPQYKHVKRLILTDQPMIKTTTGKVKRFEEIKGM